MKAALLLGYGGSDRLTLGVAETPRPGAGQLLVRVRATSVNPIDWKVRQGKLRLLLPARFPLILGRDVAGEVTEIGPEVTRFEPGDQVYALLDSRHGGGYAEYAVVGQAAAALKPEGLSFEEAAALPLAGLTALQALRDQGELGRSAPAARSNSSPIEPLALAAPAVLVNGASGGVGHLAVQIAAALGAAVTAVAGPRHQELLRQLGARRALDYTREDFTAEDGEYAVIFDAHGGRSYRECEPVLADDGIFITTLPGPSILLAALKAQFNSRFGMRRRPRWIVARPSGEDLELLGHLVALGKLRPVIDRIFPLEQVALAHDASESGHVRGKLVLRID